MGTKTPKIELIPITKLRPNPDNPRVNDHAVDAVAKSIQAFGFNNPIITDGWLKVCAGHTRLKAAEKLGMKLVPVIRVPGLRGSKFTGYSIADNKTGEIADWHEDLLRKMVWELKGDDNFNDMGALGFADRELNEILRDPDDTKADAAPDPPKKAISKPGDLWVLGEHRLLCGDALVAKGVPPVDALFTDPPYGIDYDPGWLDGVGRKRKALSSRDTLKGDDGTLDLSFLWGHARRMVWGFPYIFDQAATGWVVWDKQPGVDRRGIVTPIEVASTTMRKGFDMVRCMWGGYYRAAGEKRFAHPTQKPVKVVGTFVDRWTKSGELIFDPFVGSGTTIIACEQTERCCFAIEIEPKYVDVCVERWEQYTGGKAKRQRRK